MLSKAVMNFIWRTNRGAMSTLTYMCCYFLRVFLLVQGLKLEDISVFHTSEIIGSGDQNIQLWKRAWKC